MTTAVDTSILLDILRPNPDFVEQSAGLIESSAREGRLVICDLVYAELAANFEDARHAGLLSARCADSL